MLDRNFKFPEKGLGLYGNLDYTWNFNTHFPILTSEYLESVTGVNLASKKGSTELAEKELIKVSTLAKAHLFKSLLPATKKKLEYKIAKDQETLYEVLQYQIMIFEAGFVDGAWLTMFNTEDKPTIGKAAEEYLKSSTLLTYKWGFYLDENEVRKDY